MRRLMVAGLLMLGACVSGPAETDWTGAKGAQPFSTAVAACSESSYNIEVNFVTCMAGRGWRKTS